MYLTGVTFFPPLPFAPRAPLQQRYGIDSRNPISGAAGQMVPSQNRLELKGRSLQAVTHRAELLYEVVPYQKEAIVEEGEAKKDLPFRNFWR